MRAVLSKIKIEILQEIDKSIDVLLLKKIKTSKENALKFLSLME